MWVCAFVFFYGLYALWMARSAMLFLFLLIPIPDVLAEPIVRFLQERSADFALWLFRICTVPVFREGLVLQIPTLDLVVAEQCSGIRSSWVLFITSLLASHLFLRSPWRRLVLVAFVIPLGVLRNGFRILVIGLLCVHVGPHMIDSVIHHRGGPFFFTLSLVPLFLLSWWLRRQEQRLKVPI
jgi:exosortase